MSETLSMDSVHAVGFAKQFHNRRNETQEAKTEYLTFLADKIKASDSIRTFVKLLLDLERTNREEVLKLTPTKLLEFFSQRANQGN